MNRRTQSGYREKSSRATCNTCHTEAMVVFMPGPPHTPCGQPGQLRDWSSPTRCRTTQQPWRSWGWAEYQQLRRRWTIGCHVQSRTTPLHLQCTCNRHKQTINIMQLVQCVCHPEHCFLVPCRMQIFKLNRELVEWTTIKMPNQYAHRQHSNTNHCLRGPINRNSAHHAADRSKDNHWYLSTFEFVHQYVGYFIP